MWIKRSSLFNWWCQDKELIWYTFFECIPSSNSFVISFHQGNNPWNEVLMCQTYSEDLRIKTLPKITQPFSRKSRMQIKMYLVSKFSLSSRCWRRFGVEFEGWIEVNQGGKQKVIAGNENNSNKGTGNKVNDIIWKVSRVFNYNIGSWNGTLKNRVEI